MLIPLVSVLNLLYFYISTFRSMCAVPNMAVFWSSLTSCFPDIIIIIINTFIFKIYCHTLCRSRMLFLIGEYKISEMETKGLLEMTWRRHVCSCVPYIVRSKRLLLRSVCSKYLRFRSRSARYNFPIEIEI